MEKTVVTFILSTDIINNSGNKTIFGDQATIVFLEVLRLHNNIAGGKKVTYVAFNNKYTTILSSKRHILMHHTIAACIYFDMLKEFH